MKAAYRSLAGVAERAVHRKGDEWINKPKYPYGALFTDRKKVKKKEFA